MSSSLRARPSAKWWALFVISLTQLVVVLDGTIVNIALPQAQIALNMDDHLRQWVVTAYALAFGALLLLGGRIADYWGRKRTFMVGMIGFGLASLYAGVAGTGGELILGRGLQGVFAAMLAPAALALLTTLFPSGTERNTAFAVFGTVAGAGAAVGLVLGGFLTEFFDWRWCLLVNLFFVAIGLIGGALFLAESKAAGDNRYDIWGALLVTAGLGALVYGFSIAESGWGDPLTIGFLAAGILLLALFVRVQTKVANPLLPLRVVTNRVRGGAFLIQAVAGTVMIGATVYLTFHLQIVLGQSALQAGLASLPLPLGTMVLAPLATKMLGRIGPRPMLITGPLVVAAGLFYLSFITADGEYFVQVAPALLVMGLGMSFVFIPLQNVALTGVAPHDAGVASAVTNSAMQIGGSIGLSVFTAVYAVAVGGSAGGVSPEALADGYGATFVAAAIGMLIASGIAIVMVRGRKEDLLPQGSVASSAEPVAGR
ncbi:EmrB/QacA subfamily drug resistance transporter [Microbacterium ginsengiterrae]|uniref:EmrB/QacA subfamily drug resistance transporter n=1 Tax=Microbacterium ginsengiterrae TaxID=546115 RepID=A0A7W9CD36_9MICO|nr:MFS transporter [Microbacterium ginsengiterrae]MBB5743268.1 EmrB/QacA subfamily drug resistance transporter [Microbacterium ginsengiterrae]